MKAAYEAPFPTAESKAGAAQFPLLVPTADDQPGASVMREVMDELSRWEKPALVMFSDSDPVFPYPRAGQVFCDLIPGAGEQVRSRAPRTSSRRTAARRSASGCWRCCATARRRPDG